MPEFNVPSPDLQIEFSYALGQLRSLYLQDALAKALDDLEILELDRELSAYVPQENLRTLARHGLRGELIYPVPCVLVANPHLLGYYRLLLGFSQKEFYSSQFGLSRFKSMESKGSLTDKNKATLPELCKSLIGSAVSLTEGIGVDRLSRELLDDLTLLTAGPQMRGGANVKKGHAGIVDVFKAIHNIVEHAATRSSESRIEIENAAGRRVFIEFAPDPDIVIREEMSSESFRNIIAIEVKGGTDFSNIHNRVGEAEKSHQKARAAGFVECWTVVNVDRIDMLMARQESPSTNRFFLLSDLKHRREQYQDFRVRVISLTGIRSE
ncbi:MAG: XcyI family restriction endonuclease [Candidatus Hydrogenedentes bacterium]|nr:XcyI family restriction endonuclease [Candidatus Hydrogenedentota bacterium]